VKLKKEAFPEDRQLEFVMNSRRRNFGWSDLFPGAEHPLSLMA